MLNSKVIIGSLTLVIFFVFGIIFSGIHQPTQLITRDPAAIKNSFDFTHLSGLNLQEALRDKAILGYEVVKNVDLIGIQVGHFVIKNQEGHKTVGCREFPKLKFIFEADGTAINGEVPKLEIEGNCQHEQDLTKTKPLWLPIEKILKDQPLDGEYRFYEENFASLRFSHLLDSWPRRWILKSVSFIGKTQLVWNDDDIRAAVGKPLTLTFQ